MEREGDADRDAELGRAMQSPSPVDFEVKEGVVMVPGTVYLVDGTYETILRSRQDEA